MYAFAILYYVGGANDFFYRCITYKFELYLSLSVKIPVMSSERDEFQTVEDVASSEVYQCNHELHDTDRHVTILSSELKYTILYGAWYSWLVLVKSE